MERNQPGAVAVGSKPRTRRRWGVAALLSTGVLVNYLDRVNLTVAGPLIQKEFGIGPATMGLLLSGFFWTYAILQIPVGLLLDRRGVRPIMLVSGALWSIASFATSFATGFRTLFGMRMLLGIAEAPGCPASAKATGHWFPRSERSLATALFDAAAKFSNVIAVPLVAFLVVALGWRGAFAATGLISLGYFLLFRWLYHDPSQDPQLEADERQYIVDGGAVPEGFAHSSSLGMLSYLLRQRKVWGLCLGFAAYGYAFALFISWLPSYLVQQLHMSILKSATFTTIPWAFATITDLAVGGWLIDRLVGAGRDETTVRKSIIVGGLMMGLTVFGAGFTRAPAWALIWITISLSGLAAAAPADWSLPTLIAPRGGAATIGELMNFCNSLSGIAAPLVTGFLVEETQSFSSAFVVAGVILALGIFAYVVVLGRIEPVPEPA